jgi:iron complex outermembrane receptor protein
MKIKQHTIKPLLMRRSLIALSVASLLPTFVAAEDAPELPAVNVSRDKQKALKSTTSPTIETAKERMNTIAGGANVVDGESYRQGRVSNLQDALGYSPGVFIQPRFGSDEARMSIRGSGVQRTFHMRGLNMFQDGIPLNLADGGVDFQAIDPLTYNYTEVYRGANAMQYGGTTLGGAVNFVSPTGYTAPNYQLRMEGGSYGYLRSQASLGGVKENVDYYLNYTHTEQDGFRDHAKQNNHRVSGNLGIKINDQLETRFFAGYVDSKSQLPGSITKQQLIDTPRLREQNPFVVPVGFNFAKMDPNNNGDQARDFNHWRIANKTTYTFGKNRIEANAFYSYKDLNHPIFLVLNQISHDYGGGLRFVSDENIFGHKNIFTAGLSLQNGYTKDRRYFNQYGKTVGLPMSAYNQSAFNLTTYVENQHYFTPQFVGIIGGQWTMARRKQADVLTPDAGFATTFQKFIPKAGVRYEIDKDIQVFANYSQSFEPPSFAELSGGQLVSLVRDQSGHTIEIGSRGRLPAWHTEWDVSYYHAWVKNELLSVVATSGSNPLGTINGGNTVHQGIELGLTHRFLDEHLTVRQAYLWNDFHFDNDIQFKNNQLAGIPEHFYRASAVYNWDQGFYFGPNVEWTPSRYAVDHANTLFANGYALLGIKAGYNLKKYGVDLFIEGRNLTDKHYAASTGVVMDAGGKDTAQFWSGDGTTVYGGVQWRM